MHERVEVVHTAVPPSLAGQGNTAPVSSRRPMLKHFHARFPDTAAFAMANRVVLLRASDGVPIDVALGALPFEDCAVERATDFAYSPG